MTSLFPPFNRRASFRKQPYFFEQGRGVFVRSTGQAAPVLNLNFLSGVLDPRVTFSRPSLATMYDSTGKLTFCPNNLTTYSNTPTNAAWAKSNMTVSGSVVTLTGAPGAFQLLQQSLPSTPTAGDTYIWAVKMSGSGTITLDGNGFSGSVTCTLSATPTWFFVKLTFSTGSPGGRIISYGGNTATSFTLYDASLSRVTYETSIRSQDQVTTTSSAYYGPRFDYNPSTLAARGLLIEEARTNLCLYSQSFGTAANWSNNLAGGAGAITSGQTAPSGAAQADLINITLNTDSLYQAITVTASTVYSFSFYFKAGTKSDTTVAFYDATAASFISTNATQTSIDVGSGWYRITTSVTTPAGCTSLRVYPYRGGGAGTTGTIYLFGAQLEAGSFATSYIPTGSSSVARSADSVSITGSNFSSWYNQSEGTFIAQFDDPASGTRCIVAADDNSANNHIKLLTSGTDPFLDVTVSSVQQANIDAGTVAASISYKLAGAYKANDFAACIGGGTVGTDASGSLPTVDRLRIGASQAGDALNGHMAALTYYASRLPNTRLQALTQ